MAGPSLTRCICVFLFAVAVLWFISQDKAGNSRGEAKSR